MSRNILFVDDDANILAAYRRKLRQYQMDTAQHPEQGLQMLRSKGPYAVIVADMQMPGMNGVEFLKNARTIAPDATRIMLTGNADQQTAVEAVNQGAIFRFLTKPCPTEIFTTILDAGLEQHRLVTAERDLLQKTLRGSIKVLIDLLAMLNPEGFGQAMTLKTRASLMAKTLNAPRPWEIEIAAMLYPIGQLTLPDELRVKISTNTPLSSQEKEIIQDAGQNSHKLLMNIPRLESVVAILQHLNNTQDAPSPEASDNDASSLATHILRILIDLASLEAAGNSIADAFIQMRKRAHRYDPAVFERVTDVVVSAPDSNPQPIEIQQLEEGFILAQDVTTDTGVLLIRKGATVSEAVKLAIRNYHSLGHLDGPVLAIPTGRWVQRNQSDESRKAS